MNSRDMIQEMDERYALFGFLFAFHNRLQAAVDTFYEEITCKQFFLLACMNLFTEHPPTVYELAQVMGCSHQNAKQIINKLEAKGFLKITPDKGDKRKLRISLTKKANELAVNYHEKETQFMQQLYKGIDKKEVGNVLSVLLQMEENLINFEETSV